MSHQHGHDDPSHSHAHSHDDATNPGHSHGHGHAAQVEDEPPSSNSQRYEMEDLFRNEAPENQHFFKVAGLVLLVVLLALAIAYPFLIR
jgi:hypothetical protein